MAAAVRGVREERPIVQINGVPVRLEPAREAAIRDAIGGLEEALERRPRALEERVAVVQLEPTLCQKICEVFLSAVTWIVEMVAIHIFCMPRSTAIAPEHPKPEPPKPVVQQPVPAEPPAPEVPLPPGRAQGRLSLEGVGGDVFIHFCGLQFLQNFWDHLRGNRPDEQIGALIDRSLRQGAEHMQAQEQEGEENPFPRVREVRLFQVGQEIAATYADQLNGLHLHAIRNPQHMTGCIVRKGDKEHVLLVDARDRERPRFFHLNLVANPVYLQRRDTLDEMVQHLNETLPIAEGEALGFRPYFVRVD